MAKAKRKRRVEVPRCLNCNWPLNAVEIERYGDMCIACWTGWEGTDTGDPIEPRAPRPYYRPDRSE